MSIFVRVARKSEIAVRSAKLVEIGDKRIALFNLGNEFYAIDDTCPTLAVRCAKAPSRAKRLNVLGMIRGSTSRPAV